MWRVQRFYRPVADGIEVIRVLHSSRDLAAVLDEDPKGSPDLAAALCRGVSKIA
jgi:hypothetical protein